MSASGRRISKMEGTAFRAKPGDRDVVIWLTAGWSADAVFLSSDGTKLVRIEEDMIYLYKNGLVLAARPAKSTSLGERILIDVRRSGFSAAEKDFRLVTASGKTEIFSLYVEKLSLKEAGKLALVGSKTVAQRVESTVSYDRSVRNYAEVRVNVEGQNRGGRARVENSVLDKQTTSTFIGVQTRVDTNSPKSQRSVEANTHSELNDSKVATKHVITQGSEQREEPQQAQKPEHRASDLIKNSLIFR